MNYGHWHVYPSETFFEFLPHADHPAQLNIEAVEHVQFSRIAMCVQHSGKNSGSMSCIASQFDHITSYVPGQDLIHQEIEVDDLFGAYHFIMVVKAPMKLHWHA